jgi:ubiquinone/menaquinone biosynthesis C-methylase UbiE
MFLCLIYIKQLKIRKNMTDIKKNNRYKRYLKIIKLLNIKSTDTIIDVGCGKQDRSFRCFNKENKITGLDLYPLKEVINEHSNFSYVQGNATNLPFKDNQFDVAISIGMFEHIHPYKDFLKALKEVDRVSKKYAIVVPHRYGFIEPHFQVPFWYFYPNFLKSFLISKFNLGSQKRNKNGVYQKLNHPSGRFYKNYLKGCKIYHYFYGPLLLYYIIYKD